MGKFRVIMEPLNVGSCDVGTFVLAHLSEHSDVCSKSNLLLEMPVSDE